MQMKDFSWTEINRMGTTITYVANVPGGMIVRTETTNGLMDGSVASCSESLVFIPVGNKKDGN